MEQSSIASTYSNNTSLTHIQHVFMSISEYVAYIGGITELLIFIFLIFNWKNKSSSTGSSSYFHLLAIRYFIDLFCLLTRHIPGIHLPLEFPLLSFIKNTSQWYVSLITGPWNVALCLNRLTSILWFNQHPELWSSKNFKYVLGLLFIYPFLVNGYSFANFHCKTALYSPECASFMKQIYFIVSISNGVCALLSLVIGIATTILYHIRMKNNSNIATVQLKVERNLLFQSFFSSICFGVFCIAVATYPFYFALRENPSYFFVFILNDFAIHILFNIFHFSSFVLLLIYSKALRQEIIKFYSNFLKCQQIISFIKFRRRTFMGINEIAPK